MGRQSEVGMYLVGNYHSPVLLTDIRYPAQLPGCPDTPAGIMRITKNKRPAPLNVLSETLEINVIMPVMQIKRRVNDFTSHTFGHQKERMVYRSHYHHLIARLGKALQGKGLSTHNTGHKRQHITRDIPLVTPAQPMANRGIPLFTGESISQNRMVETSAQSVHYKRRRTEIHIGHPHGKQITTPPYILYAVPLYGVRTAAFDHFIKIILHKVQVVLNREKDKNSHIP